MAISTEMKINKSEGLFENSGFSYSQKGAKTKVGYRYTVTFDSKQKAFDFWTQLFNASGEIRKIVDRMSIQCIENTCVVVSDTPKLDSKFIEFCTANLSGRKSVSLDPPIPATQK